MKRECECVWERKDVELEDGFEYHYDQCDNCGRVMFEPSQVQKLMDYASEHQFMFLNDWILAWLYSGGDAPVRGITALQKQIVIITYEFAPENDIPTENPGFKSYKFGPYSERIDRQIQELMDMGLVISEGGRINSKQERFTLSDKGLEYGRKAFGKLTEEQQEKLKALRRDLQQFDVDGIMRYVYKKYPELTDKSVILERTLRRRRS